MKKAEYLKATDGGMKRKDAAGWQVKEAKQKERNSGRLCLDLREMPWGWR